MAKFNQAGVAPVHVTSTPTTFTHEGAPAFAKAYEMELYQATLTTLFGESTFYEGSNERGKRLEQLIRRCVEKGESEFVAKLAVYAREQMHLRSIPIFLVVTLAKVLREVEGAEFNKIRAVTARVIQRADELREMFAAAESVFGDSSNNKVFKKVAPKAIFKGISDAFNKFDAYQFRKYSGGKGHVKFSDVMRVVHPTPINAEKSDLFKQVMEGTLPLIDTWETQSAAVGQGDYANDKEKALAKKQMWQEHANDPKQGYMAKLRNLRNYTENDVDLTNVISHLTNPIAVAKSKQLPFRFYTAYTQLGGKCLTHSYYNWSYNDTTTDKVVGSPQLLAALEDAFDLSVGNLPDLGDDVLIVVDQSGSMTSRISDKGVVTCAEIAAVLGTAAWFNQVQKGKKAMVAGFACDGKVYNWSTRKSALDAAKEMMNTNLGGSTNISSAWSAAKGAKLKPSTIIVLSDMQMTGRRWGYGNIMNPEDYGLADKDTLKISIDLRGYRNTPFAVNNGWYQLSGWSDRVFDFVTAMQRPGDAIKLIKNGVDI